MRKIFAFLVIILMCWGFVAAQVPDNPQVVVCETPSILDTLRGETPVCPTLDVPTVALDEVTDRVGFSVPVAGGLSFDGIQGHFSVTIDGVEGLFLVVGTFNSDHTLLEGSVMVNGDNAVSGLDLRERTLHATAVLTGCHPASAQDPTSSDGVVSETVTYTVPVECLFVFGESQYQRIGSGAFYFSAAFSGSKTGVSNYRFIIQNAEGNTVGTHTANVLGSTFSVMVPAATMASYGVGSYTAIPAVNPVYESCPSTGQPMSFEILPACTSFDSLVVYTDGEQYQLRAYIDLSALETQSPAFEITATTGQYAGGSAWYVDASRQFLATPMTALPTQQTVLQASATVEARCGVDLVNDGYVTISSQSVSLTVPMACPAFYNTEDNLSGDSYRMLSHINLNGGYDYQQAHFVVKEGTDSTEVSATYSSQSLELATGWISTTQNFPWANKTITLYPVVEVKCGLNMGSYVAITGPAISRSFLSCPELGNVFMTSNHAGDPIFRSDTLFVQIGNYNADLIHQVMFSVTIVGSSTTLEWVADGWNPVYGAAYKVLSLALLQQLGLSTTDVVATVDVSLEVNTNSVGCSNTATSGQVVSIASLPECPAFAAAAVTAVTKDYDGNITAATPLQHYNPALIHHTGVTGQDSLYYTLYVDSLGTGQMGSEAGTLGAVYDGQNQVMTCSIPYRQILPGVRYDFVPHINLSGYCNPESGAYVTIEGPSGSVVSDVFCIAYGDTTVAVRNTDGSVTLTHQLVNYNPNLLHPNPNAAPRFQVLAQGAQHPFTPVTISDEGLMSCTIPASHFESYPSENIQFKPVIYLNTTFCSQPQGATWSNCVCIPYSTLPSFTGVTNTSGEGKKVLFKNEGVILMAKVANYSTFSSHIGQTGFLISRNPITEFSADQAVYAQLGGTTGDSISYKVGMDSCGGGKIYYRPFMVLNGCDPKIVLGTQKYFLMWAPELTLAANPETVAAGGTVTLNAVATMTVNSWNQPAGENPAPCILLPNYISSCNIDYTEDCSTTKNMETWMKLLVGLRNCSSFWNSMGNYIINNMGMDPGDADFQYRWERNGSVIFSSATSSAPGTTTVTPTTTTTYTGIADFTYNDVHCIQKQNITVTVP